MFAEIKSSECGIMIHCQLDDQIKSPADFSHFDPICLLALAPPTSPVLDRGRMGARADGRKSAAACARGSSSSVEEEAAAAAAVGSCDGRDFRRRRRSWRSPSLRCSPSLHPSSSFSACLPARPPRAPRRGLHRPARRAVTTSPRIFAVGIHSCSLSKTLPKVRRIFSTRAQRPARFDTALP